MKIRRKPTLGSVERYHWQEDPKEPSSQNEGHEENGVPLSWWRAEREARRVWWPPVHSSSPWEMDKGDRGCLALSLQRQVLEIAHWECLSEEGLVHEVWCDEWMWLPSSGEQVRHLTWRFRLERLGSRGECHCCGRNKLPLPTATEELGDVHRCKPPPVLALPSPHTPIWELNRRISRANPQPQRTILYPMAGQPLSTEVPWWGVLTSRCWGVLKRSYSSLYSTISG